MVPLANPLRVGLRPVLAERVALWDGLFLTSVVLWSLLFYVSQLGFYVDDWAFLRLLYMSSDQSLLGLYEALHGGDIVLRQRPVQIVYLALAYRLFGAQPLGFHLINSGVLVLSAILFFLVLRELKLPRLLTLALPLVYILLPHYSTDRFWIAAFQAPLSIALYLLSLYADLRAVRGHLWFWKGLSIGSLLASGLAYEVTLALFLLNPLMVWYRARQHYGATAGDQFVRSRLLSLFGGNFLALLLLIGFKALITVRVNLESDLLTHISTLVAGAIKVNYGTYGLALPYVLLWILRNNPSWLLLGSAAALGLLVFAYLYPISVRSTMPQAELWLAMLVSGLVIFGLGYAVFITNADTWFTSASLGNRIAIAAAIGVALSFVGACGWVTCFLSAAWYRRAFCLLVALLCVTGFLINNTLATFWIETRRQQELLLDDIQLHVPVLPSYSTLILDGVCLEHGGAYIFTGKRDLAGALAILYEDDTLWATAITTKPRIEDDGLTLGYFNRDIHYPYGPQLLLYNVEQQQSYTLENVNSAQRYFESSGFDPDEDCPPGFAWGTNSR